MLKPVLVILGPTAAGKSELALAVATKLGGEIVGADSMQIYRGMDIGTAKPSTAEREVVPHHLIDLVDPTEDFSVAAYQAIGRETLRAVHERGRIPIIVGGTGLYVRALLHDYDFSAPGRDDGLRSELADLARTEGTPALRQRLLAVDPEAAAKIHPNDQRRLVRALEVWHSTGRPISASWGELPALFDTLKIGLTLPRAQLVARINERVDAMVAAGLVQEVRALMARGYSPAMVSWQALGYKEIAAALSGATPVHAAIDAVKLATRRYAKRQMTWFRHEPGVQWIAGPGAGEGRPLSAVLALVRARWGTKYEAPRSIY